MNRILGFILVAIFAVFLGSQITEGCLLLPYWKTLSATEFHAYYNAFGPGIGQFYTILTISAALIPLGLSIYCFTKQSKALKYSIASTIFAILFIAFFYIYFKDANQLFYDAALDAEQLKSELAIWGYWHWSRVAIEIFSLIFLILALNYLTKK